MMSDFFVHPTAEVSAEAKIGQGTRIWNRAQVREGAVLGDGCIVGKDAYVDMDVRIGSHVKIQNSALLYHGATLEDGVFIGPQVCLTNDLYPRAINPDGSLKGASDWEVGETVIRYGASVGAGAIIVTGVEVGRFAMIGAGAVVTHDVPAHGLALGVPARLVGYVCACGARLDVDAQGCGHCARCGSIVEVGEDSK
ncbi:acyltransferase [Caldilinea sp.]|uniref:acyltransferase n=1 Tax=Caldilinea sp. TaxID=2293560 RepID=UPI002C2AEF6B|nr:acyltransferase [Caldilinea sp.]